jgi:hypothetical protein
LKIGPITRPLAPEIGEPPLQDPVSYLDPGRLFELPFSNEMSVVCSFAFLDFKNAITLDLLKSKEENTQMITEYIQCMEPFRTQVLEHLLSLVDESIYLIDVKKTDEFTYYDRQTRQFQIFKVPIPFSTTIHIYAKDVYSPVLQHLLSVVPHQGN